MDKLTQQKCKTINRLLFDDHVLAHVDSTKQGVDLPKHLMGKQSVVLKLSKLFRGGIVVEQNRIQTNLLFDFGYYVCVIPLEAVWGVTSDNGKSTIWPESVPGDLLSQMVAASAVSSSADDAEKEQAKERPRTKTATHLRRVK